MGPNTLLPTKFTQTAIDQVSRLYFDFTLPPSVTTIYYNFQDISWAEQEWAKISLNPQANQAANMCKSVETCWGAVAEIDLKGRGLLLIASKDPGASALDHSSGAGEAHEYTHTIQSTQFLGTSKEASAYCCTKAYMPWWMVEGNAAFTQAVVTYSKSYSDYLEERKRNTNNLIGNKVFTQEWLQNYIDTTSTAEWNKPENSDRMYDVGFLVNESLASIYGPKVNMKLFKDVAGGMTWGQAFEANVGILWSDALPKLALILKEMISQ